MQLQGAVAVVTGGASGLGLAAARSLAEAGATVFLFDRDEARGAEAARAGIASAEKTLGRDGPHRAETFQRTLDINLTGSFLCARRAAELMARNTPDADGARGAIVLTASIAAFEGQKGQVAYAASKGGVAAMVLPMARDLASIGIRVNAIAPGVFLTPMLEGLGPEVQEALAADVVFPRRLGDPAEFVGLVRFLLGCGYMNGTTVRIDGALRMG